MDPSLNLGCWFPINELGTAEFGTAERRDNIPLRFSKTNFLFSNFLFFYQWMALLLILPRLCLVSVSQRVWGLGECLRRIWGDFLTETRERCILPVEFNTSVLPTPPIFPSAISPVSIYYYYLFSLPGLLLFFLPGTD